jgi:hypothetical protein
MMSQSGRRPTAVTVIAVLAILAAIAALLTGIGLFGSLALPQVTQRTRNPSALLFVLFMGAWCVVGGLAQLVAAVYLLRGAPWSRILLTVLFVLHLGFVGVNSAAVHDGPSTVVLVTVVAAIALAVLWATAASAWFDRSRRVAA